MCRDSVRAPFTAWKCSFSSGTNSVALPSSVFSITRLIPFYCLSFSQLLVSFVFITVLFLFPEQSGLLHCFTPSGLLLLAVPITSQGIVPVFLQTWRWRSARDCCA